MFELNLSGKQSLLIHNTFSSEKTGLNLLDKYFLYLNILSQQSSIIGTQKFFSLTCSMIFCLEPTI